MLDFHFYILGVLDLLGQSEGLKTLDDELILKSINSQSEEDRQLIRNLLQPTIGRVLEFRSQMEKMIQKINSPLPIPSDLPKWVTPETFNRFSGANIQTEYMGDAALFKVCLGDKDPFPLSSVKFLMDELSRNFLAYIADKKPLRGALELGWGTHLPVPAQSIYGTMLSRAFQLEKEAGYPRIIIGKSFFKYIREMSLNSEPGPLTEESSFVLSVSQSILSAIVPDEDGHLILNYLDRTFYTSNIPAFDVLVKDAKIFIKNEIQRFHKNGPEKLYHQYYKLKSYFQRNKCW